MSYSIDLRRKVLEFVSNGGSQLDAAKHFGINPRTVYCWQKRKNIEPNPRKSWQGKIDKNELIQFVKNNNDMILREYAEHFGVHINAIWSAFRSLGIRKKNDAIQGTYVYKKD